MSKNQRINKFFATQPIDEDGEIHEHQNVDQDEVFVIPEDDEDDRSNVTVNQKQDIVAPATYNFKVYANPKSPEWIGFLRSAEQDSSRKQKAKCISCGTVLSGILDSPRKHKGKCVLMSEKIRKQVKKTEPAKVSTTQTTTLPSLVEKNKTHQEKMDFVLAMFFIMNDIPYR